MQIASDLILLSLSFLLYSFGYLLLFVLFTKKMCHLQYGKQSQVKNLCFFLALRMSGLSQGETIIIKYEVRLSKTLTLNELCGFWIFMMILFSQRNKKLNTVKTQNQRAHSKTSFQSVFFIWNSIDQYFAYCESLDNVPKTFKELSFQIKENTVA